MRVTIRSKTYRGKQGFSFTASEKGYYYARIFVLHLSTALALKVAFKTGRGNDWMYIDGLIREDGAQ